MTQWNFVWKSYMDDCKRIRVMRDIYDSVTGVNKIILLVSAVFFMISIIVAISTKILGLSCNQNLWFLGILVSEGVFLLCALKAKKTYKEKFYSKHDLSQAPPEDDGHQEIRYLKFRKKLIDEQIDSDNIKKILEILSFREEMEEVSGLYAKRFAGFTIALIIALMVALLKLAPLLLLALILAISFIVGLFIYFIASLIPSPVEKIRELKYFLVLYQSESLNSTELRLMNLQKESAI